MIKSKSNQILSLFVKSNQILTFSMLCNYVYQSRVNVLLPTLDAASWYLNVFVCGIAGILLRKLQFNY